MSSSKPFKLVSDYQPRGDQPVAIAQLTDAVNRGETRQVLLGLTGSGKTFTAACVIEKTQRPTLIIAHNKTLWEGKYYVRPAKTNSQRWALEHAQCLQRNAWLEDTATMLMWDLWNPRCESPWELDELEKAGGSLVAPDTQHQYNMPEGMR